MPVRMSHKNSPKSQSQVDQEWLQKIKEKRRFDKALDIALKLETIVPWDLTSSSMLFAHGEFRRQAENILLDLLGRGGEAGLTRGAKLFAKCDLDRDGGLNGEEVLAMTAALQEDVGGREAITPPSVNFNDIDQATTAALERFREDGVDRLHELSLLRLLVPPPQARSKASTTFTVRSVAAAAASRARGGAAGRELAARQAVEEELLADRQRVRAACGGVVVVGSSSSGSIGPLPLLTFLDAFLTLTTELGLHQASVEALAAAHRHRMEEAKRVLEEAERRAREEREGEAARVAERVRRRRSMQLEEEARGGELVRLINRQAAKHDGETVEVEEEEEQPLVAVAAIEEAPEATGEVPAADEPPAAYTRPAAIRSPGGGAAVPVPYYTGRPKKPFHSAVTIGSSKWRPRFQLDYFEKGAVRRHHGVDRLLGAIDPEPLKVRYSEDGMFAEREPPTLYTDY